MAKVIYNGTVPKEWIDYNGHMNDADYVRAFSLSIDEFMKYIGITEQFRKEQAYTMYTLETHVIYLDEMHHEEPFEVHVYLLDYDEKRTHLFLELYGKEMKRAAVSEQMLIGIDQKTGRSALFPEKIKINISQFYEKYAPDKELAEVGRVIGIRRK